MLNNRKSFQIRSLDRQLPVVRSYDDGIRVTLRNRATLTGPHHASGVNITNVVLGPDPCAGLKFVRCRDHLPFRAARATFRQTFLAEELTSSHGHKVS